ncbi:hypothetical protein J25TS5_15550 [Paenibacillus faecis]|nr:hypothetical protein J25TS5_15550 [Paenibacillus faecis]
MRTRSKWRWATRPWSGPGAATAPVCAAWDRSRPCSGGHRMGSSLSRRPEETVRYKILGVRLPP